GTRRIATAGTERATELSPALRGLLFINPQHPGCSPLAPARLTCAPTPKSSCRSFGERHSLANWGEGLPVALGTHPLVHRGPLSNRCCSSVLRASTAMRLR